MNAELKIALQMYIDQVTKGTGTPPDLDDIHDFLQRMTESMNRAPRENFDGYSSEQMHRMIHCLWDDTSPIVLNRLSDEEYMQIPLFRQIITLTSILTEKGKIKLTTTGALPTAIVKEVYSVGTHEWYIDEFRTSRLTEASVINVQRPNIMLQLLGATKIQKGVMTLTVKGKKLTKDKHRLLSELLQIYTYKFNWGYFDLYENTDIGRMGLGFSLAMVAKYGTVWRDDKFYAEKYFKAFPPSSLNINCKEPPSEHCYTLRTFPRFMLEFGLIEMKEAEKNQEKSSTIAFNTNKCIRKSKSFDKLFTFGSM